MFVGESVHLAGVDLLFCLFVTLLISSGLEFFQLVLRMFFRLECSRGAKAGTRSKEKAQGEGWRMRSDPGPLLHSNRQSHLLRRLSASRFFSRPNGLPKNSCTHEVCGYSNRVLAFNEH